MRSKMRKMRSKMQRRIPQGNPNLCKQHQSSMTYLGVWAGSLINLLGSTGPNRAIMRRMRSKMQKMRSKMRKMRRRMSKMRTQCEDA